MQGPRTPTRFVADEALGYRAAATRFGDGRGLAFDARYRRAQLPLVAPGHPLALHGQAGEPYRHGRRAPSTSLVVIVPDAALSASPACRALAADLRAAPFAAKLAWGMAERRRHLLHATLAGELSEAEIAWATSPAGRRAFAALGPFAVDLRGPFSGSVNLGRLYLRAYPEERGGRGAFAEAQGLLGRGPTDLFPVGIHNLVEELTPPEAEALARIVETWWERSLLAFEVRRLTLLRASDDLVLDGEAVAEIALGDPAAAPP